MAKKNNKKEQKPRKYTQAEQDAIISLAMLKHDPILNRQLRARNSVYNTRVHDSTEVRNYEPKRNIPSETYEGRPMHPAPQNYTFHDMNKLYAKIKTKNNKECLCGNLIFNNGTKCEKCFQEEMLKENKFVKKYIKIDEYYPEPTYEKFNSNSSINNKKFLVKNEHLNSKDPIINYPDEIIKRQNFDNNIDYDNSNKDSDNDDEESEYDTSDTISSMKIPVIPKKRGRKYLKELRKEITDLITEIEAKYYKFPESEMKQYGKLLQNIDFFANNSFKKGLITDENMRKAKHAITEHNRRNAINIGIKTLAEMIPGLKNKSKKVVLFFTVKHILEMKRDVSNLMKTYREIKPKKK